MSVGKIVTGVLRSDATIGPLVGNSRVYPVDAIPENATTPWINYQVSSNVPDRDLGGTINGHAAEISLEIVAATYAEVQAILDGLPAAIDAIIGTTIAGLFVEAAEAGDTGDEINGPITANDGQAFVGSGQISIYYRSAS